MKALEEKILAEGTILPGNVLKVGGFLNQQMDSDLIMEIGREIARLYAGEKITRVLTVESSGIAIAVLGILALFAPLPAKPENEKSESFIDNLKNAHFSLESAALILMMDLVITQISYL